MKSNNLRSVESMWDEFQSVVFADMKPSSCQYNEMRKAFYAGAIQMFGVVEAMGSSDVGEVEAVSYFENIEAELLRFAQHQVNLHAQNN